MLLKDILCILLLIPMSTAKRGFTIKCEGESTTLSCLDQRNHNEDKVEITALWKKGSGERVIWNDKGVNIKGDTYTNRTIRLNDDLSLSIDGCDQSDQSIYILCINGKPSCEVRLFVKDSKQCETKTSEQSTRSPAFAMLKEDKKNLQTKTTLPDTNNRYRATVSFLPCLFGIVVLFLVFYIWRKEKIKQDKLPHRDCTDLQSNNDSA